MGAGTDKDRKEIAAKPFVLVSVRIPHLHVFGQHLFLFDTGADHSILSARVLLRPPEQFGPATHTAHGIGGEEERWFSRTGKLRIANGTDILDITPDRLFVMRKLRYCLLGRDVLVQHNLKHFMDLNAPAFYLESNGLAPNRTAESAEPLQALPAAAVAPRRDSPAPATTRPKN